MAHLIDKDVLLTKIEKRQSILDLDSPFGQGGMIELELVKDILNTLEVKETQYINKDILIANIKKLMYDANLEADIASTGDCFDENIADAKYQLCKHILGIINTFEIKDIDLDMKKITPEDVAKILEINGIMQIELKDIPGYIPTYDWNKMIADKFNELNK